MYMDVRVASLPGSRVEQVKRSGVWSTLVALATSYMVAGIQYNGRSCDKIDRAPLLLHLHVCEGSLGTRLMYIDGLQGACPIT